MDGRHEFLDQDRIGETDADVGQYDECAQCENDHGTELIEKLFQLFTSI